MEIPTSQPEPTIYVVRHYAPERPDPEYFSVVIETLAAGYRKVLAASLLGAAVGLAYVLLAAPWYRAEVLLIPAGNQSAQGLLAQFGGLASLAGIDVGGAEVVEPVAVLRSRALIQRFIETREIITVLLARKWDAEEGRWKGDEKDWPDIRDAVRYFDRKIRHVSEDRRSGLVTLAIEWKDPKAAAEWANGLARLLNDQMRERAISQANKNIQYLRMELDRNSVIAAQQSISRLLEYEIQKLMLAKGNEDFAFRVVDQAEVPKKRIRPLRALTVVMATVGGAILGALIVIAQGLIRRRKRDLA